MVNRDKLITSSKCKIMKMCTSCFIVMIMAMSLLCIFSLSGFFNDPGFLWHLRNGEDIVNKLAIPYVDNYLSVERPWISDQWLSDVTIFLMYKLGRFEFIYYFYTFLYLFFIFIFFREKVLKKYSDSLVSVIASYFIILVCRMHFIARPVAFSFFLMVLLLYLLESLKENKYKKINFLFFLLFLIWANVHPSFFLGFFIWFVFCLENFIKNYKSFEYKKYLTLSFIIIGATLINPYFISLHESILFLNNSSFFMDLNDEWHPIKLASVLGMLSTIVMSIILIFFVISKSYRSRIGAMYFIVSLVFYIYGVTHQRGITYFSIVSSLPLCVAIHRILSIKISNRIYILRAFPKFYRDMLLFFNHRESCYFTVAIVLALLIFKNYNSSIGFRPSNKIFPYKITQFINDKKLTGNVLASPNYGGFLIYYARNIKPIICDRNTLIGEDLYKKYLKARIDSKALNNLAIEQNAPYVLVDTFREHKRLLKSDAFRVLFKSGKFVLFKVKYFDKKG